MRAVVARYADFESARASPTELLVSTTEWETRQNVLFSSKDDAAGWTDEERVLQFLASFAIPVLCSEKVVIRGRRYCDGGLSNHFPIDALVERGCEEILIVDPSPTRPRSLDHLARPLARPLWRIPLSVTRLAAGYVESRVQVAPTAHTRARIRVLVPERPLTVSGLDFRNVEGVRKAIEDGKAAGERVAREMMASGAKTGAG
jgi:predicted patatin/cPLA2 family phospholipase